MREWLYPGAKVVCVDDQWHGLGWHSTKGVPCPLKAGMIYTVDSVLPGIGTYIPGVKSDVVVTLKGVEKPLAPRDSGGFSYLRFRPLQKRKTDISVFTQLLTPSPKEKADA